MGIFMINLDKLQKIFPATPSKTLEIYVDPLNATLERFALTSQVAQCCFLAQIGHESANLTATKENLNYSKDALLSVFGKYFTPALATQYARKPEAIANRVYANRMGNGDEKSGDGWKFKGRGLIQLTGRNNYMAFKKYMGIYTDEDLIRYLETPTGAVMSAGWFFETNGLVPIANKGDMLNLTKRINGGLNGLDHRMKLYQLASTVIRVNK